MKAAPEDQTALLTLQKIDQNLTKLRHQIKVHPAHEKLKVLEGRAEDLHRAAISQGAVNTDIKREIARIEQDTERLQARRQLQQTRLEDGQVPLRDMNAMEHEIAQMDRRMSELENAQLSVEERLDEGLSAQQAMVDEAAAIVEDGKQTKESFTLETADLDEQIKGLTQDRDSLVSALPPALVKEYDRTWNNNGPLAVVEVRGAIAFGAATEISPAELSKIILLAPDEVYWSDETEQIVVRTSKPE